MIFGGFVNLANSFNSLIGVASRTAAMGIDTSAIIALGTETGQGNDDLERTAKAVAKMSLAGMLR